MSRWIALALAGALVAGVTIASSYSEPVNLSGGLSPASVVTTQLDAGVANIVVANVGTANVGTENADVVKAGIVDGGTIRASVVMNTPLLTANIVDAGTVATSIVVNSPLVTASVVDAGTVYASTLGSYAAVDSISCNLPNKTKLCLNGDTCTVYIRADDVFGNTLNSPSGVNWSTNRGFTVAGNFAVGGNGVNISEIPRGSATLDFPDTAITTCDDLTLTVTGSAAAGEVALSVPNGSVATGSMFFAWISAAGTATVRHCCLGAATCDPASGTFSVRTLDP